MRRLLGNIFRSEGDFAVDIARDGVEALAKAHTFKPDVMTLDVQMPNMDGLACLDRIMIECPTRVIMVSSLTAEGADETFEAMHLGAVDFIAKPEGAASLTIDELAPLLIEKVRLAASQRLRTSRRLTERVRYRAKRRRTGAWEGPQPRVASSHQRPARLRLQTAWLWSAPRPAARRPSMRCSRRCRPISPGRSSSLSTCPRRSPGRWRGGSIASAH